MKKRKTRKKLERWKDKGYKLAAIINIFWGIFMLIIVIFLCLKITNLETQLSECQEQVLVWNSNDCVDIEYWYNNGEGRDFNDINGIMLKDTINCLERVIE